MNRISAACSLAFFLMCLGVRSAMPAIDGTDEAEGTSFIERHWWDFLIVFFLISMIFAYSDEDRTMQAVFWSVVTVIYLIYICLFRNSAIYSTGLLLGGNPYLV